MHYWTYCDCFDVLNTETNGPMNFYIFGASPETTLPLLPSRCILFSHLFFVKNKIGLRKYKSIIVYDGRWYDSLMCIFKRNGWWQEKAMKTSVSRAAWAARLKARPSRWTTLLANLTFLDLWVVHSLTLFDSSF